MKIAIVGPFPPPYGGISIHVQRLMQKLEMDGFEVNVNKNMTVRRWIIFGRWHWFKYDIVHFHDTRWSD